jgi:hypothetical protein
MPDNPLFQAPTFPDQPDIAPPAPSRDEVEELRPLAVPPSVTQPRRRIHEVEGRDGEITRILGRQLAHGTSHRAEHSHPVAESPDSHHTERFALRSERCSACRWFEVSIYAVDADVVEHCTCNAAHDCEHTDECGTEPASGRYLVVTAGRTQVPGEVNFRRAVYTDSPYEVIELLVQQRDIPGADGPHRFIPQTSTRALAHAASYDEGIREAYLAHSTSAVRRPSSGPTFNPGLVA